MSVRPDLKYRLVYLLAWLAPVWALVAVATGGVGWMIGPIRLSSRQPWRILLVGLAAAAYLAWRAPRAAIDAEARWVEGWLKRAVPYVMGVAVLAALVIGIRFGSFAAGGADSYGYVSQATLWLNGSLRTAQPWVQQMSWPNREFTFAPLGYHPTSGDDGTIIPTYSVGLPIIMAGFQAVLGPDGPFYVVPVLGALGIWLTFLLGREATGSRAVGVCAALLLLSSPAFLAHLMLPMTDVPMAVGWTLVMVLALKEPRPWPLAAGLAAGASLLVRPNLVLLPMAPVVAWLWPCVRRQVAWRPALIRVALFVGGMLPWLVAIAAVNKYLYGSPLQSGYGNVSEMFSLALGSQNLRMYGRSLLQSQSALVVFALIPLVVTGALRREETSSSARAGLLTLMATTLISYVFYSDFNHWLYLRFLLPAFPALFVMMAAGFRAVCRRLPKPAVTPALTVLGLACVVWGYMFARDQFLFTQREFERRYVQAARYVDQLTPSNAVILSMQHSGSVRYYAHRITLRYDWLYKHRLDTTLRELQEKGYKPYIVLDDWEEKEFRKQFAELNQAGRLDWAPMVRIAGNPEVHIYDPTGRFDVLPGQEIK